MPSPTALYNRVAHGIAVPVDTMHTHNTHRPGWVASLSTDNSLQPPTAISLCLGGCGRLELRLEVICLSPAAGCHLASVNQFHLRCH